MNTDMIVTRNHQFLLSLWTILYDLWTYIIYVKDKYANDGY